MKSAKQLWNERNRERILGYYRKYQEKHPGGHAQWRKANRDKVLATARRSYQKNRRFIKLAYTYGISVPEARARFTDDV